VKQDSDSNRNLSTVEKLERKCGNQLAFCVQVNVIVVASQCGVVASDGQRKAAASLAAVLAMYQLMTIARLQ